MNDDSKKYEYFADDPNVKVMPIMVSLIIGAFFAILNETLLNIALTTLMAEFTISLTDSTVDGNRFYASDGNRYSSIGCFNAMVHDKAIIFGYDGYFYDWHDGMCDCAKFSNIINWPTHSSGWNGFTHANYF